MGSVAQPARVDDSARYKNEIHALLSVLFPEFLQVFADPCRPTALAVLKSYPSAQAMAAAEVEAVGGLFRRVAPRNDRRKTARQLIDLAQHSAKSGTAVAVWTCGLNILCDQLEHTQTNLAQFEEEIDHHLGADSEAKGMRSAPEFGRKMGAVWRAELGDVTRFQRADQVAAYTGLDIEVRKTRQVERRGQAFQEREWAAPSTLIYDGSPLCPAQGLCLFRPSRILTYWTPLARFRCPFASFNGIISHRFPQRVFHWSHESPYISHPCSTDVYCRNVATGALYNDGRGFRRWSTRFGSLASP